MDEKRLKEILQNFDAPDADENAKKRAINLAMAEFEENQKKKEKKFQGSSILSRLMGSSNKQRRTPMEKKAHKKLVYGGMATAMVVVLVAGISMQQLPTHIKPGKNFAETSQSITGGEKAPVSRITADKKSLLKQDGRELDIAAQVAAEPEEQALERWRRTQEKDGAKAELAVNQETPQATAEGKALGYAADAMVAMESRAMIAPTSPSIMADDVISPGYYKDIGRDQFEDFEENPVKLVTEEPVSTFSIDVDTSSYSFMRRQINSGVLPQKDSVRIEEMVNYFDYGYPLPETREQPFEPSVTVIPSPWKDGNQLVHIGIKGFDIDADEKPRSNLVFLLDVSGSMNSPDKLPLLKNSMKMLLDTLSPDDTVGIVVYAGAAGTVLEPTKASEKQKIIAALENLSAGGSTAGAEGIRQAYNLAESNFDEGAVNRVILATDGDFNVGITNREELKDFVERKRDTGVFLSVLGFGQGNYNDHLMQELAQNGNGVAAYIDSLNEARKVLVEEASSTLFPIAKDVKIQVEFNPETVAEYRLVGYETRHLNREDFNNDAVDAGDIGAGHTVTAIYEITPVGGPRTVDDSRYQKVENAEAETNFSDEYAFLKIRYKLPNEDTSKLITTSITRDDEMPLVSSLCPPDAQCIWAGEEAAPDDVRFSTAVAGFGQLLKGGKHTGEFDYDNVIEMAQNAKGTDPFGYRAEFIQLVRLAKSAADMQKN